ncbi:MAG: hypothetical protein HY562_01145 [Ignavibacteriales bacterium]|nr:hypothetical protein [Ignavibacteriales bacterium]
MAFQEELSNELIARVWMETTNSLSKPPDLMQHDDARDESEAALVGGGKLRRVLRKWTEEEIRFLKKHYKRNGRKFVADYLRRTQTSVAGQARQLGVLAEEHRPWTVFEDRYIRKNYGTKKSRSIAHTLRRSVHSVRARASKFKLTREKPKPYSQEERSLVRRLYEQGVSATKIAKQAGFSASALRTRIGRWGFKSSRPWKKQEERFLKKHFHRMTYEELAKALGRTESAVTHYANRHGLKKVLRQGSPANAK